MSDAPPARYSISDVAEYFCITRQTIHNWIKWGLLTPIEVKRGRQVFGASVFDRVRLINKLKAVNTITQIKQRLP